MEPVQVFLFGFPRVEREGRAVPVNRRKMLALLAYLLATRQPHSRETLAAMFWPEYDTSSAMANLRRNLSFLKEILGEGLLDIAREKVRIHHEAELWVDVWAFENAVRKAEEHGHFRSPHGAGLTACAGCLADLEEAAALHTADFLAGFNLPDSPSFDEWQFFQGERLRSLLAEVLVHAARAHIEQGSYDRAVEPARRWLAIDPLHEPAHRMLMQLYAWAGQPTAALRQYHVLEDLLEQELGGTPEPETTQLYEAVRTRKIAVPVTGTAAAQAAASPRGGSTPALAPPERYRVESLLFTGGFGEI